MDIQSRDDFRFMVDPTVCEHDRGTTEVNFYDQTRLKHPSVITPQAAKGAGVKEPDPFFYRSIRLAAFTLNNDEAGSNSKIDSLYTGSGLSFHVHWTKSTDAIETGNAVRWQVSMTYFKSAPSGVLPASAEQTWELEDTYDAADTTERTFYRVALGESIEGPLPGYYIGLRIVAVTPVGTPLTAEPALYSVDVTYPVYVNRSS